MSASSLDDWFCLYATSGGHDMILLHTFFYVALRLLAWYRRRQCFKPLMRLRESEDGQKVWFCMNVDGLVRLGVTRSEDHFVAYLISLNIPSWAEIELRLLDRHTNNDARAIIGGIARLGIPIIITH